MSENVVRLADYERRSRNPDAVDRDPTTESAVVIILPIIRKLNAPGCSFDGATVVIGEAR